MLTSDFPWYDSVWLTNFVRACRFIERNYPDRLPLFRDAIDVFKTRPDYKVALITELLEPQLLLRIREAISTLKPNDLELHEIRSFGRWVVHDHPILTEIQHSMTPVVEKLAGEEIEVCYNFLSLYTRMGRCPVHLDAPEAKWTLDICIDQSESWPIYFSQVCDWPTDPNRWGEDWESQIKNDHTLSFDEHVLTPGSALLFSGSSQWHYREPLSGTKSFCNLLFYHFIPKGTSQLVKPSNWEQMFEVPGLTAELNTAKARGTIGG